MNWSSLLSGLGGLGSSIWGGLRPYATDPMAWLGVAGTGAGIYDMFRRQKAEADYLRQQKDWMRRVESIANAPLNVEALFNPGKALIQRDIESGLAERGLQPGGAYTSAIGEGMMRHWLNAAEIAKGQRASQLAALSGMGPARPNFPGMGDVSALGKYLQWRREQDATRSARAEQQASLRDLLNSIRGAPPTQGFNSNIPDMGLVLTTPLGSYGDEMTGFSGNPYEY